EDSWAVLHGRSDGTFHHGQLIGDASIAGVADLTGDGKADLLERDGKIHPGNGAGSFCTPIPSIVNVDYNDLRFADVNGDGRTDVLSRSGNHLTVFLSSGGGQFTIAPETWTYEIRAVTDLNTDGYVDLVVGSYETYVQLGKGDGTFTDLRPYSDFPLTDGDGEAADFDGDHHVDLALGSHILFGNGDGTFHSATSVRTDANFGFQLLGVANGKLILRSDQDVIALLTLDTASEGTKRPAMTLRPESNPAPYGAGIALTARVAGDDGIRPRGAVRFESAGKTIALVALDEKATATTYWGFELGTTTVTATYVGDERLASASTSIAQQAVKAPAMINITSYRVTADHALRESRTVKYGEMIYFSGYVSPTFGSGYAWPTGEITIRKGAQVIGTLSGFTGIHTWSALPAGTHTITFEWAGDAHYLPSSTTMKITVTPGPLPTKGRATRH
ncbi:MAG TPA: Ig-like domain repeat protein, partial [Thermoanaerobaculia bacterium]|nr:Ig-like domain repeat protein [Thermoanaerobaculia bacterium]